MDRRHFTALVIVLALVVVWKSQRPTEGENPSQGRQLLAAQQEGRGAPSTLSSKSIQDSAADRTDDGSDLASATVEPGRARVQPDSSASEAIRSSELLVTHDSRAGAIRVFVLQGSAGGRGATEAPWHELVTTEGDGRFDVEPGEWTVVAVNSTGAVSGPGRVEVPPGMTAEVALSFDARCVIQGVLCDLLTGARIVGGVIRVLRVDGVEQDPLPVESAQFCSPQSTDSSGRFELRVPGNSEVKLAAEAAGYAADTLDIVFRERDSVDVQGWTLTPVEVLEVQLVGSTPSMMGDYRVGRAWTDERIEFDESGRARIACPQHVEVTSIALYHPNDVTQLVVLPGRVTDASPLRIDVGRRAELNVTVAGPVREGLQRVVQVHAHGDAALELEWNVPVVQGEAHFSALPTGPATVGLFIVEGDTFRWIEARTIQLRATEVTHVTFDSERTPFRLTLVAADGAPLANASLGISLPRDPTGWFPPTWTDADGACWVPRRTEPLLLLSGLDARERVLADFPLSLDFTGSDEGLVRLGAPERYDLQLTSDVSGGAWHSVSLRTRQAQRLLFPLIMEVNGDMEPFEIYPGSDVVLWIDDARVFERGMEFPLHPGLNAIPVHGAGTLELELSLEHAEFEVHLTKVGAPDAVAQWLRAGRLALTESVRGGRRVLRATPLPVGRYQWQTNHGQRLEVFLERAGAVSLSSL